MLEKASKFISKKLDHAKGNLLWLLIGTVAGAGLTLWLTNRRGRSTASVAGPVVQPRRIAPPPPPRQAQGMGEHQADPARYATTNLDDEVDDPDVDFVVGGEF